MTLSDAIKPSISACEVAGYLKPGLLSKHSVTLVAGASPDALTNVVARTYTRVRYILASTVLTRSQVGRRFHLVTDGSSKPPGRDSVCACSHRRGDSCDAAKGPPGRWPAIKNDALRCQNFKMADQGRPREKISFARGGS